MSAVREYAYKPAALRGAVVCKVSADRLQTGDDWQVDFADVHAAAFSTQVVGDARFIRLDLWTGEQMRSLSYTANANAWHSDPDARVFLGLVRDVLQALAEVSPELEVTLGSKGGPRTAMFAVGVVSLLAGGGIFAAALATGISGDRLAGAAVPMLLLVGLGGLVAYSYSPWRRPRTGRPGAVAAMIDDMIGKLADSTDPQRDA